MLKSYRARYPIGALWRNPLQLYSRCFVSAAKASYTQATSLVLTGVIATDSNQDLRAETKEDVLNRFLLILSDRIFDSTVDLGMPRVVAAPDGPNTSPPLSFSADAIVPFSWAANFCEKLILLGSSFTTAVEESSSHPQQNSRFRT